MSLIISDERISILETIFTKYNYNNIIYCESRNHNYYFLPPELVLKENPEYRIYKREVDPNTFENWIYQGDMDWVCIEYLGITKQEYFDLIVLHINDTDLRPKCIECGTQLRFESIVWGYSGFNHKYKPLEKKFRFCCKSCSNYFTFSHPELYPEVVNRGWSNNPEFSVKSCYTRILNGGSDSDPYFFYVASCGDNFKFGVCKNVYDRLALQARLAEPYKSFHKLILTRRTAANLEAWLKKTLEFREYLDWSEIPRFKNLFRKYYPLRFINAYD